MNKTIIWITAVIIVVAGAYLVMQGMPNNQSQQQSAPDQNQQQTAPAQTQDSEPQTPTNPMSAEVIMENFSFQPHVVKVAVGVTVTWANQDSAPHQVKSDAFNSEIMQKGQTFKFTFTQAGTFNYLCSLHPTMTGTVIVE